MSEAEASAPEAITYPSGKDDSQKIENVDKDLDKTQRIREKPEEGEDDEDETCGFCKFMKAGGCKETFVNWMECVDSEKAKGHDFVETCMDEIQALRECMLAHSDYYRPMLEEEQGLMEDLEPKNDAIIEQPSKENVMNKHKQTRSA